MQEYNTRSKCLKRCKSRTQMEKFHGLCNARQLLRPGDRKQAPKCHVICVHTIIIILSPAPGTTVLGESGANSASFTIAVALVIFLCKSLASLPRADGTNLAITALFLRLPQQKKQFMRSCKLRLSHKLTWHLRLCDENGN